MQSLFRTINVKVLDLDIKIGELSVDQVDDLVLADAPAPKDGKSEAVVEGNRHFVREKMSPVIAASLRNAEEGNAEWYTKGMKDWPESSKKAVAEDAVSAAWTPKRAAQLGFAVVTGLYTEICKLTGLSTGSKEEAAPSKGEEPAAARVM